MKTSLFVVYLVCTSALSARAQVTGSQAGQIFNDSISGRAMGMSNAQTALSGQASALYYNPAGLSAMEGQQAEAMHAALYGGATFDYIGYGQNLRRNTGGWGIEAVRQNVGDIIGLDALNHPTGNYTYSEMGVAAGIGVNDGFLSDLNKGFPFDSNNSIFNKASLGASVKILNRKLLNYSNNLAGIDLGVQYGPIFRDKLSFGLTLKNALTLAVGNTADRMPTSANFGMACQILEPVLLETDISKYATLGSAEAYHYRLGLEYTLRFGGEYSFQMASLRAGYSSDGITFGGGVTLRRELSFDVAILDNSTLGISQRASISYRFGAYRPKHLISMALENLTTARDALEKRDYVTADHDLKSAIDADPLVGSRPMIDNGRWKNKAAWLNEIVRGLELTSHPKDAATLMDASISAKIAGRAVKNLLDNNLSDAMLLAQVAAGESSRGSVFYHLLHLFSKIAKRPIVQANILPVEDFILSRVLMTNQAFIIKRYDEAIDACRQNVIIVPDNARAWERLGSAYFAAGKITEARAAYSKSMLLNPYNKKLEEFMRMQLKK